MNALRPIALEIIKFPLKPDDRVKAYFPLSLTSCVHRGGREREQWLCIRFLGKQRNVDTNETEEEEAEKSNCERVGVGKLVS